MSGNSPILGIDFGTTNTSAAWFDGTQLRIVPVTDKSRMLPSVAWYHSADKVFIGHHARQQILDDPANAVFGSKRFLGRRFRSEFVSQSRARFAFDICEGENGLAAIKVHGVVKSFRRVAQDIIQHMLTLSRHSANQPFERCVLTVPAHYSFRQRNELRAAAEGCGLEVAAMVNEPTAAALYYSRTKLPEKMVLVFDLGGGTFDATLLEIDKRRVRVLSTGGDAFLGGADFDQAIAEHLVEEFERQHGIELRSNKIVMQRLVFAAEGAKLALSQHESTILRVPCITKKNDRFLDFEYTITRELLSKMIWKLVERAAEACDNVVKRAGVTPAQVQDLVFVGGQTRTPAIQARFKHYRRREADPVVDPGLGVAVGAAVLARALFENTEPGLLDVIPIPIGIMQAGVGTREVIGANTRLPCTQTVVIEDRPPPGAPLVIAMYEALSETTTDRELLGSLRIEPEWLAKNPGIPNLELHMGQDFRLRATLIANNGERSELKIHEPKGS